MQATRPILRFGLCTALVVSIGTFALTQSASAVPTSYLPLYGTTVPASSATTGTGQLSSISCADATHCESVGLYATNNTGPLGIYAQSIVAGVAGTPTPLATGADDASTAPSISCFDANDCVAVFAVGSGTSATTDVATETSGSWSVTSPFSAQILAQGISCVVASSFCAVVGESTSSNRAFGVTLSAGVWGTTQTISDVGSPTHSTDLVSVSCWSIGNCTAAGNFNVGAPSYFGRTPFVAGLSSGSWIATPGGGANSGTNSSSYNSISCPSATTCLAAGTSNGIAFTQEFYGTRWYSIDLVQLPTNSYVLSNASSVSCVDASDCVVVGSYQTQTLGEQAFYGSDSITNGDLNGNVHANVVTSPYSGTIDPVGVQAYLNSVSCPSTSNCEFVGSYNTDINSDPTLPAFGGSGTPPPSAPTSLSALPGNHSITVSWSAPLANGSPSPTSYTAYAGSNSCTTKGLSCTVTGLINGQTYQVTAAASNAKGQGPVADAISGFAAGVPDPPTVVSVVPGAKSALVTIAPPANNNGAPVTSYTYYWAVGSKVTMAGSITGLSWDLAGLPNGATVSFYATATNVTGASAPATPVTVTLPELAGAPTNVVAIGAASTITVSWNASTLGATATSYTATATEPSFEGSGSFTCTTTSTTCTITGLGLHKSFSVTVAANNAVGSNASNSVQTFTTTSPVGPPGAVTALTAKGSKTSIALKWKAPKNHGAGIGNYIVYEYVSSAWVQVATPVLANVSISKLSSKTSYKFEVVSYAMDGQTSKPVTVSSKTT